MSFNFISSSIAPSEKATKSKMQDIKKPGLKPGFSKNILVFYSVAFPAAGSAGASSFFSGKGLPSMSNFSILKSLRAFSMTS